MTQLTLNIKNNQINFFLELIKRLDFVKVEEISSDIELTEYQKNILNERLEDYKSNPESYLESDYLKGNLRNKYSYSISQESNIEINNAIEALYKLKKKYQDIEISDNSELQPWQKDIIDERMKKIADGNEKFQDFETAIDEIEKEL